MKVAIIGGGAVGLLQAILLQNKGVEVSVYEKEVGPKPKRVVGLDPKSLILFHELGYLDELLAIGRKIPGADIFDGDKKIAHFSFEMVSKEFSFLLIFLLPELEDFLEQKVSSLQKGIELVALDGKECEFSDGSKATFDVIIGADGASSRVRDFASISFSQKKHDLSLEISRLKVEKEQQFAEIYFEKGKTCALCLPYSKDHVQVIRAMHPAQEPIAESKVLKGENEATFVLNLEESLASTFYKDGILLLGDAAHHMTPFGGRGLNLSIQDAQGYAEALVHGGIEEYAKKRKERAAKVIHETHQLAITMGRGRRRAVWLFKLMNRFSSLFTKLMRLHVNITNNH